MIETYNLKWHNIDIVIEYKPETFKAYREVYGVALAHIQVKCSTSLPITDTGSLSRYMRADRIEEWGGPVEYIKAWLDQEATSPQWKAHIERTRQLTLF